MSQINEFWAVTETSVYHVRANSKYSASAVKIALKGDSKFPIGKDIAENNMVAIILGHLQTFLPEKHGQLSPMADFERRIELVNTNYWLNQSSRIIALFLTEDEAMTCFNAPDQKCNDPRWNTSTQKVLKEIGHEHPSFYVSTNPEYAPMGG